jgi:hypothetical protein
MKNKNYYKKFSLCFFIGASMVSCSNNQNPQNSASLNVADFSSLKIPPKISVTEINSPEFALSGFNVGLASKTAGQVPSINFIIPPKADFVQLIRCRSDAQLTELFEINQNSAETKTVWQKFIIKDYFKIAAENPQCVMITAGFSSTSYIDVFAPSGSFRYLGRACATRERITDIGDIPVGDCGRWVSVTSVLTGFKNKNKEIENDNQRKSREMRDEADTLTRRMYFLTADINSELLKCDKTWDKNVKNKNKRDAIFNFLQKGVGLGMSVFSYAPPVDAVQIISGIQNIFASPNDFQRSCTQAEVYRKEGEIIASQLKSLNTQFSDIVVKAGDGQ